MPRKRKDGIPKAVMKMANEQVDHIRTILSETGASEEAREARARACPSSRRDILMEQFDKERAEEKMKIMRMREDHAMLLDRALHEHREAQFSPRVVLRGAGAFVPKGTGVPGLYADKKVPDKPGTTAEDLAFQKDTYKILDPDRGSKKHGSNLTRRGGRSSNASTARSTGSIEMSFERNDLLAQRDAILEKLKGLSSIEEKMAAGGFSGRSSSLSGFGSGRSRASGFSGNNRSSLAPMSARSTASSAASGATFCDIEAPMKWRSNLPRNVPPLRQFQIS